MSLFPTPICYRGRGKTRSRLFLVPLLISEYLYVSKYMLIPSSGKMPRGGGGHLHLKLDIILVKKNHVIRVVFQDQAMYARTSFRSAKTCKIGKKRCVFGHIDKFGKGHDGQI